MAEIFEFIFELLFQALFEALADVTWRRMPDPVRVATKALLASAFALLLAFLSARFFPEPFISSRPLAIAYLVIGPLLVAWMMAGVGGWMERKEKRRGTLERFAYGWIFAFSFAVTRFVLTRRA